MQGAKHEAGIQSGKLVNETGNEAGGEQRAASNPNFASRRIGNRLDIFHCLAQVIEGSVRLLDRVL